MENNTDSGESRRILEVLSQARAQIERLKEPRDERIAIIGMACRVPGAESVDDFWNMLEQGQSGIRTLSEEELLSSGVPREQFERDDYVRCFASFEDPTGFDASFFGYSPGEAELLDPQHRVFLECAWTALEDAGYDTSQFDGKSGVYGGAALNSYLVNLANNPHLRDSVNPVQAVVSNVMGLMPSRVSYHLNLKGPSCGIQTGCSSSLVAVHEACRGLLDKDCDMALAGGVTIGQAKPEGYLHEPGSIASPDGCCRAFDEQGRGTLFGNGVGLVVLKRLSDAIKDRDSIRTVILSTAVNNDGSDKVGLLAPSVNGQADVIHHAIRKARISAADIAFVEAHGTATDLGDPVEVAALDQAMGEGLRQADAKCAIGSVKTNVGHLDAAAGVIGLIKATLALQHRMLPASLHFKSPNPKITLEDRPFYVAAKSIDWSGDTEALRAGVSSFGMGGTNAHAILETPPVKKASPEEEPGWVILPLSARSEKALNLKKSALADHLENASSYLPDLAYTLQVGRCAMPFRQTIVSKNIEEAVSLMRVESNAPMQAVEEPPALVFMFTGQGSQYDGMAQALYNQDVFFRSILDECGELLRPHLDLKEVLFGQNQKGALSATETAQPALFAVEYSLARWVMHRGVQPSAMIGHSLGEYVAACLAGVFSLSDALHLVAFRGQLMQRCESGDMLAVMSDEATLSPLLNDDLEIAAINSPKQTVLSGPSDKVAAFEQLLTKKGITCQRLGTSHAFHSVMMEPVLAPFREQLKKLTLQSPSLDMISNRTGKWLTADEATQPEYWVEHLRFSVRFSDGLATLMQMHRPVFLEIGPGKTLCQFARSNGDKTVLALSTLPGSHEPQDCQKRLSYTMAELWQHGVPMDWKSFHDIERSRVPLPTYPFQRTSYFVEPSDGFSPAPQADSSSKKLNLEEWFQIPGWRQQSIPSMPCDEETVFLFAHQNHLAGFKQCFSTDKVIFIDPVQGCSEPGCTTDWDPLSLASYSELFQTIDFNGTRTIRLIHAWSLLPDGPDGFESLTILGQFLASMDSRSLVQLDVAVPDIFRIESSDILNAEHAKILGLLTVLPQEISNLQVRLIEGKPGDRFFQQIANEMRSPYRWDHKIVAYRSTRRWVRTYDPIPLSSNHPEVLQEGAVYAVVGDLLDGLGMIYSCALREEYAAKVILIGRKGLPSPNEWDTWLATHGNQHPVSQLIQRMKALGREGVDFVMTSVDLGDAKAMSEAFKESMARLDNSPLQGVFYADVMGGEASCALVDLKKEDTQRILDHKVHTINALNGIIAELQPKFTLFQSSLSSVLGGRGFAAYAAANTYLDQWINRLEAPHVQCINWDACSLDEQEQTASSELMAQAMNPKEVWEATKRVMASPGLSQVVVTPRSLYPRLEESLKILEPANTDFSDIDSNHMKNNYVAPRTPVESAVAKAMGDLLGISRISIHDDFFALGGHSLLAIQAITKLRKQFGVDLPMRAILQGTPTVAGISQVIEENMAGLDEGEAMVLEDLLEKIEKDDS